MRKVRLELLRPDEIIREKSRFPVVYLPIGPLEWHGPHLAIGMDPLNAEFISRKVAEKIGGVVLPTFFWGTERERSPEMLKSIGLNEEAWIVGMDFPANTVESFYIKEDIFGVAVREYLRILTRQKYKLIVIVNGHGAENHINVLRRLAKEFTAETDSTVLYTMAITAIEENAQSFGHATKAETSILSYINTDCVDISTLPEKDKKLRNVEYAIVDGETFDGNPNIDFTVREDPRDASIEYGRKLIERSITQISNLVLETWSEMEKA
ncbi:MAG: creatininase family protein [Acetivibrionales bacterium]